MRLLITVSIIFFLICWACLAYASGGFDAKDMSKVLKIYKDNAMMSRTYTEVPAFIGLAEALKWAEEHKHEEFTRRKLESIIKNLEDKGRALAIEYKKLLDDGKITMADYSFKVGDVMAKKELYEKALEMFRKYKAENKGSTFYSGSVPIKK